MLKEAENHVNQGSELNYLKERFGQTHFSTSLSTLMRSISADRLIKMMFAKFTKLS